MRRGEREETDGHASPRGRAAALRLRHQIILTIVISGSRSARSERSERLRSKW